MIEQVKEGFEPERLELAIARLKGPEKEAWYADLLNIFGLTRERVDGTIGQQTPIAKLMIDYLTNDILSTSCSEDPERARYWSIFAELVIQEFDLLICQYDLTTIIQNFGMSEEEALEAISEISSVGIIFLQYLAEKIGEELIMCLDENLQSHIIEWVKGKTNDGLLLIVDYLKSPEEVIEMIERTLAEHEITMERESEAKEENEIRQEPDVEHEIPKRIDWQTLLKEKRWQKLAVLISKNIEIFAKEKGGKIEASRNARMILDYFHIKTIQQLRNVVLQRDSVGQILLQYFAGNIAQWLIADIKTIMGEEGKVLVKEISQSTPIGLDSVIVCVEKICKDDTQTSNLRQLVYATAIHIAKLEEERRKSGFYERRGKALYGISIN